MNVESLLAQIRRLDKSGVVIQDALTVYIDPVGVPSGAPKADIVLLTCSRESYYSEKDVVSVSSDATIVAGPKDCVARFRLNQLPIRPEETKGILGFSVQSLPAYEERGGEHPRDRDWLGYLLNFSGVTVFYPGATGWTSELAAVHPDIVLWPLAGCPIASADRSSLAGYLKHMAPKAVVPVNGAGAGEAEALEKLAFAVSDGGLALYKPERIV